MFRSASAADGSRRLPSVFLPHRRTVVPPGSTLVPVKTGPWPSAPPSSTAGSIRRNSDELDSCFTVPSAPLKELLVVPTKPKT
ncbi:hypothetical protein F2P81_007509 [Scophthalmus maximus]|uniref:Uncharacterized protein n=1 Tax=Scophthalmus maximus TaxID=52904 RepID=A0A6A4T7U1_SCOMX|nr:hypothetical protein F2P81_007509 [Scophthalmus maximus]